VQHGGRLPGFTSAASSVRGVKRGCMACIGSFGDYNAIAIKLISGIEQFAGKEEGEREEKRKF
jgi:hypothetical protein